MFHSTLDQNRDHLLAALQTAARAAQQVLYGKD